MEEAVEPVLAAVTAYVSQDCTGMKDAVDKSDRWAHGPKQLVLPPTAVLQGISGARV